MDKLRFDKEKVLLELYQNPDSVSSFSTPKKLYAVAKKINPRISLKDVHSFLQNQESYTLHRLTRKKIPTQKVIVSTPRVIVSLDLIDMSKLSSDNENVKFLMFFIDNFSKKITVVPILNKSKTEILRGLTYFFDIEGNDKYVRIFSDYEPSLYSRLVKDYLLKNRKKVYSNSSVERKNPIAEANLKYLKYKIYKYLTHYNTNTYIHVLEDLVNSINNSSHSSFKNKFLTRNILHKITNTHFLNEQFHKMFDIKRRFLKNPSQFLKVGQYVRIPSTSRTQDVFFKGYTASNTNEIFKISSIDKKRQPFLYKLKDLAGNEIEGSFYSYELTITKLKKKYPIKIIGERRKGRKIQYKVHFIGWPSQFDTYIDASRISDEKK